MSGLIHNTAVDAHGEPIPGLTKRVAALAGDIKISHTIFAMPFALLATFLAASTGGRIPCPVTIGLIILCMALARTIAMAVNRWADADLDGLNARTAGRAIPAGRLDRRFVLSAALLAGSGFIISTAGFWVHRGNVYPLVLSPFVLAWVAAYSFTKRFTWLCHLFLGSALAISPLAATIAVEPGWLREPGPYLLSVMVMFWVAGFDIIYALQDEEVDRRTGVYSMPARIGVNASLWVSRGLHLAAWVALVVLWKTTPQLGTGFGVGCMIVALLLILEHALVWGSKTHRIHMAFFTVNGVISVLLGGLGIVDVVTAV